MVSNSRWNNLLPDYTEEGEGIILEYVWPLHTGYEMASKIKIVEQEPRSVKGIFKH